MYPESTSEPTEFTIKLYMNDEFVPDDGVLEFDSGEVTIKRSEVTSLETVCTLVKERARIPEIPVLYTMEKGCRTFVRDLSSLVYAVKHRLLVFAKKTRFTPPASRQASENDVFTKSSPLAVELATIHPQVQASIWKSVVRVSCEDEFYGTGIVVDKDVDSLYILTNIHLITENLAPFVSSDFRKQMARYIKVNPHGRLSDKRKRDTVDPPIIRIEQVTDVDENIELVAEFVLDSSVCWGSNADFDYVIWKVPTPAGSSLERCQISRAVCDTMAVHIFGFPGVLQTSQFHHRYSIIPAQVCGIISSLLLNRIINFI